MNLFIVSSPLQLINASEARHFYNIDAQDSYLVILDFYGDENKKQILNVLGNYNWPNLKVFSYSPKQGKIALLTSIRKVISYFKRKRFSRLFIGDYYAYEVRAIVNEITFENLYIFDDGNASILVLKNLQLNKKEEFGIRYYFYWLFGLNVKPPLKFNLFSSYSFSEEINETHEINIDRNEYSLLRSNFSSQPKASEILILGVKFVEAKFNTLEQYQERLGAMITFLKSNYAGDIVYIPHRHEDLNKVNLLQERLGFKLRNTNSSIEAYLVNEAHPNVVATFFSSALFNLKLIFGKELPLLSFYIEVSKDIPSSYEEYEKLGIKVIKTY